MFKACFTSRTAKEYKASAGSRTEDVSNQALPREAQERPTGTTAATSTSGKGSPPPLAASFSAPVSPFSTAAAPRTKATVNATRVQDMQAGNVSYCDARDLMHGLRLNQQQLGRGTYGIVVPGTYQGAACAVKIMISPAGLDRAALCELLLGPSLVHPNVVSTFVSRCAPLTDEFFDFLEGDGGTAHKPNEPRMLEPIPLVSGDGFGDPVGAQDGADPMLVLHHVLHALGARTGQVAVVMVQELCDRSTLDCAIRKGIYRAGPLWNGRLARRALLRTAAEVARGLLHMHDAGVVHGDLKPANVLLCSARGDRRGFTAKVADFGLSHVLPTDASSMLADAGGSIPYMAPEAFNGKVSRATDVWAWGVVLWEMMTGTRPYTDLPAAQVATGVMEGRLHLEWPEAGGAADPLVRLGRRCLSTTPAERPSFEVIVDELVGIEREIRAELLALADAKAAGKETKAVGPDLKGIVVL